MPVPSQSWATVNPSIFSDTASPLVQVKATLRPHGAVRYQCPVTDSLVLITDDRTLADLSRPRARIRCADCGDMHLLVQDISCSGVVVPARPAA